MTMPFDSNSFVGKTVLVSGGSSGIGLGIARGFAEHGAAVMATGTSDEKLENARADQRNSAITFGLLDVRDTQAVREFFADLKQLDVLVNCQGIARPEDEWQEETFMNVIDINLNSAMRLTREALPLLSSGKGCVINIASMLSYLADSLVPAYTASKSGILGLTRAMAHRYGEQGVRVNAIAPGYHKTEMTAPLWKDPEAADKIAQRAAARRWGTVEDLIGPALFIASDAAAFVTGAVLPVDGGYHTG